MCIGEMADASGVGPDLYGGAGSNHALINLSSPSLFIYIRVKADFAQAAGWRSGQRGALITHRSKFPFLYEG